MNLNMKDLNPATFFPWPGEPEGSENGITLRIMPEAKLKEINKIATTGQRRDFMKGGQPIMVPKRDQKLYDQLFWEYVITGWSGLQEDDGKEIVCNTENRIKLMTENVKFPVMVERFLEELYQDELTNEAQEAKN